ncbi:unnamed protein product [Closterium sp. Yama58-4]|nr:unnamed protein product [Closterium sp. Yama58-4]
METDERTRRFHVPRLSLSLAVVFLLSLVALQQQTATAQAVNGSDWKTLLRIRNELNFTNPARSPKTYWKSAKSCDELFGVICDDYGYVVALTLYGVNGSLPNAIAELPSLAFLSAPSCCPFSLAVVSLLSLLTLSLSSLSFH